MSQNFLEIVVHLINGEDIKYITESPSNERNRLVDNYLDANVAYLRFKYEEGSIAYIDKRNILYMDVHEGIYSHADINRIIEDYTNENE